MQERRTREIKETVEDDIFCRVVLIGEPPKALIKLLKLKNIYFCKTQWRILYQVLGETKAINLGAGDGEGHTERGTREGADSRALGLDLSPV